MTPTGPEQRKTAASLPDELSSGADALAMNLDLPRGRVESAAIEDYLDQNCGPAITAALNEVYTDAVNTLIGGLDVLQRQTIDKDW